MLQYNTTLIKDSYNTQEYLITQVLHTHKKRDITQTERMRICNPYYYIKLLIIVL